MRLSDVALLFADSLPGSEEGMTTVGRIGGGEDVLKLKSGGGELSVRLLLLPRRHRRGVAAKESLHLSSDARTGVDTLVASKYSAGSPDKGVGSDEPGVRPLSMRGEVACPRMTDIVLATKSERDIRWTTSAT